MKRKVYIIFILPIIFGCKQSVNDAIIDKLQAECINDKKCRLAIKDVTNFDWEKMYVFSEWSISDSIGHVIGIKYHGNDVPDAHERIIFIKRNEIVYEEDLKSYDNERSTISFQKDNSAYETGRHFLTPNNAFFQVKSSKFKNSCKSCFYYVLEF